MYDATDDPYTYENSTVLVNKLDLRDQGELDDFEAEGWMRVHGEMWRARTHAPVRRGQRLRVRAIDGLTLDADPETGNGG